MAICVLTTYFNPSEFAVRKRNFDRFRNGLRAQGVPLYVAEIAFGDQPFSVEAENVHRIRSHTVLWQKERALNVLLERVPDQFDCVAWLDCDLVFQSPDWATQTESLLKTYPVVQPFERVMYLAPGEPGRAEVLRESTGAAVDLHRAGLQPLGVPYKTHGHPGYGWACRREILREVGFYDAAILGGGDELLFHAFLGDFQNEHVYNVIRTESQLRHYFEWGAAMFARVQATLGFARGEVLHLWHGTKEARRYGNRHDVLDHAAFDPNSDIRVGPEGAWEWACDKPRLKQFAVDYFRQRNEDSPMPSRPLLRTLASRVKRRLRHLSGR